MSTQYVYNTYLSHDKRITTILSQIFNTTLYDIQNQRYTVTITCITEIEAPFLYFNICVRVMLDSVSCSFTSISIFTIYYRRYVLLKMDSTSASILTNYYRRYLLLKMDSTFASHIYENSILLKQIKVIIVRVCYINEKLLLHI